MEYNTLGKYIAAALWLTNLPAPVGVEGLVTVTGAMPYGKKAKRNPPD